MQRIGTGSVCLTDRNLYFHCPEKALKIPFSKILSLDPYSNGLGVQKDGANDKLKITKVRRLSRRLMPDFTVPNHLFLVAGHPD